MLEILKISFVYFSCYSTTLLVAISCYTEIQPLVIITLCSYISQLNILRKNNNNIKSACECDKPSLLSQKYITHNKCIYIYSFSLISSQSISVTLLTVNFKASNFHSVDRISFTTVTSYMYTTYDLLYLFHFFFATLANVYIRFVHFASQSLGCWSSVLCLFVCFSSFFCVIKILQETTKEKSGGSHLNLNHLFIHFSCAFISSQSHVIILY